VFHLDETGWIGNAIRSVFGRVPMTWPAFPVHDTPTWSTEGLAVVVESEHTGYGRIHGAWHEMVVRTASLEDRFDPYERVSSVSPLWPGGQRVYIYGSLFLDHLEEQYGAGTSARMVQRTASSLIPPFLWFGGVGRRTIGESFGSAYRHWRDALAPRYRALADSLRATGLTTGTRITSHGRSALFPRVSPDGSRIAYDADDGREVNATRVLDRTTGRRLRAWRRNGSGALAWLPDGSGLVVSQLEFAGPYRLRQDLWRIDDDGEHRLTHGARVQDPDVSRTGRIVAIENGAGTTWPVLVDADGSRRALTGAMPDVHWAFPRWAPDGGRIALSRFTRGRYAIVVLDTLGRTLHEIDDDGVATSPAWSPDGRTLVWSSDRSGIANLYAAEVAAGAPLRQVTQVVTGAFTPDIAPDGEWLYFAHYAADGFHITRIPYDPADWRDPAPARLPLHADAAARGGDAGAAHVAEQTSAPRAWSPLPTVLPRYWEPVLEERGAAGNFYGLETSGEDLVGRNAWSARLTLQPESGRWAGGAVWTSARLGVPLLQLQIARDWDRFGTARLPDSSFLTVLERSDAVGLFAIVPIRRFRTSTQLTIGASWQRDSRGLLLAPDSLRLRDPRDDLFSAIGRISFANYVTNDLSISREDGISISLGGRLARERNADPELPQDFEEVTGFLAGYRALPLGGFARPVLAARASAIARFGDGADPTRIGGASGSIYEVAGLFDLGDGSLFLPVRGFGSGVRAGTRAWTASTELRVPLAIPGRRLPLTPFYFDRISLSVFGDAGDASCTAYQATLYASCARANAETGILLSAGAELVTDLGIGSWFYTRVRIGLAQPIQGPDESALVYIRFGSAF
ncbi:MAG TPA: hypothetical protein VFZ93_11010, partial [Albitalea sp.]